MNEYTDNLQGVWRYPKTPEEWENLKDRVFKLSDKDKIHYYLTGEIRDTMSRQ